MKALYILIALLVIGGGYFLYAQNSAAPTPEEIGGVDEAMMEEHDGSADAAGTRPNDQLLEEMGETASDDPDMVGGDAAVSAPMPVPGSEGVDEMVVTEEGQEGEAAAPATHVFDVSGVNFAFDVTEMRVKEGDTVTVNFESAEGFHDWVVDEFDAATEQVRPGTPTSVTFVADKAGTYEYYCSVGSHRANGMVGTLIVE